MYDDDDADEDDNDDDGPLRLLSFFLQPIERVLSSSTTGSVLTRSGPTTPGSAPPRGSTWAVTWTITCRRHRHRPPFFARASRKDSRSSRATILSKGRR